MESDLFQAMPHSQEAEYSVLGAMMLDTATIPDVVTMLREEDFYGDTNRVVYSTICAMFTNGENIDPVTVANALKVQNAESLVRDIITLVPTTKNAADYARMVKETSVQRAIINLAEDMRERARTADSSSLLNEIDQTIYRLRQGNTTKGLEKVSSVLGNVYSQMSEQARGSGGIPGLSTGLLPLDEAIMGLNKGDLIYLASRPGMGKTSLAMNIAASVAKRGNQVAVFSLEMPTEQLIRRLLSGEAYVDSKRMRTGRLDKSDWQKLAAAISSMSKAELYIDDNSMATVADMNAECRKLPNLGLVVIDYLQLMSSAAGTTAENRQQTVSEISRMLKIMAKELNVPVLCLSQLSRASTKREDKRPNLSDLRESGSLEQDADVVLGIYREKYFDGDADEEKAELIVMKNRNGMTCNIELQWLPQYTTYTAVMTRSEAEDES